MGISAINGDILAQWNNAGSGAEGLIVDHDSGNVVVVEADCIDRQCKLTEYDEQGQMLKSYVLDKDVLADQVFWRHGPDDNPSCTFVSYTHSGCSLETACWTPNATNATITQVDHCRVIAYTSNNPVGPHRVLIFRPYVTQISLTLPYE